MSQTMAFGFAFLAILYSSGSLMPAICAVLALLAMMILHLIMNQEKMLYVPDPMGGMIKPSDNPEGFRSPADFRLQYENIYFQTADSFRLHAWWIPAPYPDTAETLIFCHANAGNMGMRLPNFAEIHRKLNMNIFAFDYRGFGNSEGTPEEDGLILDGLAAMQWVKTNKGKDEVYLFGRSLGGAVAIALAEKIEDLFGEETSPSEIVKNAKKAYPSIKGIILENTFTSISQLADKLFPFLAYLKTLKNYFLRVKWDSLHRIQYVQKARFLFLVGEKDELVPPFHSSLLCDALNKGWVEAGKCGTGNYEKCDVVEEDNIKNEIKKAFSSKDTSKDTTVDTSKESRDTTGGRKIGPKTIQRIGDCTIERTNRATLAKFKEGMHNDTYHKGGAEYWKVFKEWLAGK